MESDFNNTQKTVYVILGVARSGTSVVARTLKTLGVHFGTRLTQAGKWNPTGFWEDNDVVYQINQELLDQLQFRWDSVRLLDSSYLNSPSCQLLERNAIDIIKDRLLHHTNWAFKDPRTARILPFWQSLFKQMNVSDKYVISLRNPLSSAQSFSHLGRNDLEKGLLLWLMHLIPAIEETHGKSRIIVSYENVMQNPTLQLERLQRFFNLPALSEQEVSKFTESFLKKDLDHYHYQLEDLITNAATAISPTIVKCYDCLVKLANDEISFNDAAFHALWNDIMSEFKRLYPNYCYIDSLLVENGKLRKNLKSIQRAPSWKLLYPLRIFERMISTFHKRLKKSYSTE